MSGPTWANWPASASWMSITDDPLTLFTHVDGVINSPCHRTLALVELAAQAHIVHVISTTGIGEGASQDHTASRHARIVKSGNARPGVEPPHRDGESGGSSEFDIEVLEMHHKPADQLLRLPELALLRRPELAADSRGIDLEGAARCARVTGTRGRGRGRHRLRHAARRFRGGRAHGDVRRPAERIELAHRPKAGTSSRAARWAALWGFDKPGLYSMIDVLGLE